MMLRRKLEFVFAICVLPVGLGGRYERRFPDGFLLGAATSAYQVEGGWNADGTMAKKPFDYLALAGKGVSIWDHYLHKHPDIVVDYTNGDVAADSYHLYERDVELLKELGASSYRFSLSWSRILPNGTADYINPHGIAYYNNLINTLLENHITPLVTIYHWDLPMELSDQGGWLTEKTVGLFGDYARVVFGAFGDRIKHWITVNEPYVHCYHSYEMGLFPPLVKAKGTGLYECGRHLLLAHAKAYHIYNDEFRYSQNGTVGISLDFQWALPNSDSEDATEAVNDYNTFQFGQYMDPIFKGDYPQRLIDRVAKASARQGYNSSRLRPFSQEQKEYIRGTADFVGINHYTSMIVYRNDSVRGMWDVPSFEDDAGFNTYAPLSWPTSVPAYFKEYAPGFSALLKYIKDNYGNPVVYVTENGFPLLAPSAGLNDGPKVNYLRNYLNALLDAISAGANVQGYFFWSLLDTFEWKSGYTYRFALYQVDINDPERKRTARKSALHYKEIIRSGTIDYASLQEPCPYVYTFVFHGTALAKCIVISISVIVFLCIVLLVLSRWCSSRYKGRGSKRESDISTPNVRKGPRPLYKTLLL